MNGLPRQPPRAATSNEHLPRLFVAALLSTWGRLDLRTRSLIVSRVTPFEVHHRTEAAEGVVRAFERVEITCPATGGLSLASWEAATRLAGQWAESGIQVILEEDLTVSAGTSRVPLVLFGKGNIALLQRPAATVLNSRKPRRTSPRDRWLAATRKCVQVARDRDYVVASSYGNLPYAVVSFLARGHPLLAVCPEVLPFLGSDRVQDKFLSLWEDLFDQERTLFLSPFPPGPLPPAATRCAERDHLIAALSSLFLVADVRRGGAMESILRRAQADGMEVLGPAAVGEDSGREGDPTTELNGPPPETSGDLLLDAQDNRTPPRLAIGKDPIFSDQEAMPIGAGPALSGPRQRAIPEEATSFLVHYTRSCPGPWADQTMAEYCRSLIECHGDACHTAFDTLYRILSQRLIRGSRKLTRGPQTVVSFTELMPDKLGDLVKWRRGLIRWSFEPYGVAIRKDRLHAMGARPVVYAGDARYRELPEEKKHLFQLVRPEGEDWSLEREWRLKGNLDLNAVEWKDMIVLVPRTEEADLIRRTFGVRVEPADRAGAAETLL